MEKVDKVWEAAALMHEGQENWEMHKDKMELGQHSSKKVEKQLALTFGDAIGRMHKTYFYRDTSFLEGDKCWRNWYPPEGDHNSSEEEHMVMGVKGIQRYHQQREMPPVQWHHQV